MAIEVLRVPLPEELANAVRAEACRCRVPMRAVMSAFVIERFGAWQGERMGRDFAEVAEVTNLNALFNTSP